MPHERLVMVVGNYGSGKTEVAVNLALRLAATTTVQIADLDLKNPYFRCREARALMEQRGIRVVVPPKEHAHADLPILLPEIRGMLHPPKGTVSLLDVGGDDVGARVLSTFRPDLAEGEYELWQVVNPLRPFTDSVAGCLKMQQEIERASRLAVTGLLVNAHLIDDTTAETVLEGWRLARELSAGNGLPVRCVAVLAPLVEQLGAIDDPLLPLRRTMLPPWRTPETEPVGEMNGTHRD